MATHKHTIPRRRLLAAAMPAVLALSGAAIAAPAVVSLDAELIRVCHQFAEGQFTSWYRYVLAPPELAATVDTGPDWAALHWIEATPATTPESRQAKALAFVAWHRDAFDNPADDSDGQSALLASLLRDLAAPARAVIIARLVERYGPLPEGYTADGIWIGRAAA